MAYAEQTLLSKTNIATTICVCVRVWVIGKVGRQSSRVTHTDAMDVIVAKDKTRRHEQGCTASDVVAVSERENVGSRVNRALVCRHDEPSSLCRRDVR